MSVLEDDIYIQLQSLGPTAHLVAVCDMAELDDTLRSNVRERFAGKSLPLLRDPRWHALLPYSPLLVTAESADNQGHHRLMGGFSHDLRNALHGWIISRVAPEQLAEHLARALVAYGPDGAAYLLRHYDPSVLSVLYRRAPPDWWRDFISPIASWWVPKGDTKVQRWGRIAGQVSAQASPLSPLLIDQELWQALAGDPLPHRLLQAVDTHTPELLDNECKAVRLARIESLLDNARQAGLSTHEDLHDYVFLSLASATAGLHADRCWSMALGAAVAGKGRLGDLYLSYRRQQA